MWQLMELQIETKVPWCNTLVQYSDKFMHGIAEFLIVLLRSLLLCFCTVLLSEVNTIQCHA